jgi:hypothetical protein
MSRQRWPAVVEAATRCPILGAKCGGDLRLTRSGTVTAGTRTPLTSGQALSFDIYFNKISVVVLDAAGSSLSHHSPHSRCGRRRP